MKILLPVESSAYCVQNGVVCNFEKEISNSCLISTLDNYAIKKIFSPKFAEVPAPAYLDNSGQGF